MVLANLHSSSPKASIKVISHQLLDVSAGGAASEAGSDAHLPTAAGNLPRAQQFCATEVKWISCFQNRINQA